MKFSFKRFLSSALAAVMTVSVLSVGMVTSVSADTSTTYYYLGGESTDYFTTSSQNTSNGYSDTYTFDGEQETRTIDTTTKYAKLDSNTVVFTVKGTATAEIVFGTKKDQGGGTVMSVTDSKKTEKFNSVDEDSMTSKATGKYKKVKLEGLTGKVTIARAEEGSKKEGRVYGIKVVDTVSDNAKEYTIKGTADVPDDTVLIVDGNEVTVKNKEWSYTKSSENAPYENGATVTITSNNYEDTSATLSYDAETLTYTATGAVFKELKLEPLEEHTYTPEEICNGFPKFDNRNASGVKDGSVKPNKGEFILFEVDDNATVSVDYKCGSSTEGRKSKMTLLNDGKTYEGKDSVAPERLTETLTAQNLKKGECKLTTVSDTTSAQIISITVSYPTIAKSLQPTVGNDYYTHSDTDTYIIHPVSEDDMNSPSLSIKGTDVSTDTVYDAIEFEDSSTINAEDVGGAHKIFAVVVRGTNGAAPTRAIEWVLGN